jgi:integrase
MVHIRDTRIRSLVRPGVRVWKLAPPKTKQSVRVLPLPGFVASALREQRKMANEMRLAAGPRWRDHDFVFPNDVGDPIRENHGLERWHVALDKSGLLRRRMHDLRGSAATLLWAEGTELRAIGELRTDCAPSPTAPMRCSAASPGRRRRRS